jgi:hypothetical protein
MSLIGTVIPVEGLRVRTGPSTDHDILGSLSKDEEIVLIAKVNEVWWGVVSRFGNGFVHGGFITVREEPDPVRAGGEQSYTCVGGDTLSSIGRKFGVNFMAIAALNGLIEPFVIREGQVLRIPAGAVVVTGGARGGAADSTVVAPAGTISILNPLEFDGTTEVTSASPGHHRPFGGSCSCDLDVHHLVSAGRPVRFNVAAPGGTEVRGVVSEIGFTCASHKLEDGGRMVKLNIQKRQSGGDWVESGAWVLFGHLDPVFVRVGEVVGAGQLVGALGPAGGGEYRSSCASASHIHIEATRAECVVRVRDVIRNAAVIRVA